jgi:hypothetical protein
MQLLQQFQLIQPPSFSTEYGLGLNRWPRRWPRSEPTRGPGRRQRHRRQRRPERSACASSPSGPRDEIDQDARPTHSGRRPGRRRTRRLPPPPPRPPDTSSSLPPLTTTLSYVAHAHRPVDSYETSPARVPSAAATPTMPSSRRTARIHSQQAADYLGLSINALHKLTAVRQLPVEQEAPGHKLWFRRSQLDHWRSGGHNGAFASKALPQSSL